MPDAFSAKNDMPPSLSRLLYRFDCPAPHLLGEYQLDMLEPEQRTRVASHAAECEECSAELRELRAYLAVDPALPQSLVDRLRRVLGSLVTPSPGLALGGVRGTAEATIREYQAENVSVSIGPGVERGSLIGLVTGTDSASGTVRLLAGNGVAVTESIDTLGNFELEGIEAGSYTLELELADRVVVLENLQVD